ncbi:MAG: transcription antitermination factor NusB [Syntrophothermus sp.]|nr:transcription antitermination factor NusB [Ignavibacteriaceae bacterium]
MSQVYKRRMIRERVLRILYAYEMNREGLQALVDGNLADILDKEAKDFANDLVNKVIIHQKELDDIMQNRISNWEMDRIALIDKLLIRIALCELIYFVDIPPKVSINESIEIAKLYSTAASGKFINGILDAVLNDMKEKGTINKSGRGLMDETLTKSKKNKKNDEK